MILINSRFENNGPFNLYFSTFDRLYYRNNVTFKYVLLSCIITFLTLINIYQNIKAAHRQFVNNPPGSKIENSGPFT